MRLIRGSVGCLAVALAAVGGCADSGQRAREAVPEQPGQQRGALDLGTTVLVKDVMPPPPGLYGELSSEPLDYVWTGGTLYFSAFLDSLHGREVFASDGTQAGTRLLRDFNPDIQGGAEFLPIVGFNGALFFAAYDGAAYRLWRTDGTPEGTRLFLPAGQSSFAMRGTKEIGGTLYLAGRDGSWDTELWKSDGTPEGTVRVKNLWTGGSSTPQWLTDVGGTLYFTADDGQTGRELWKSDGTPEGTVRVADLTPGSASTRFSDFEPMVAVGSRLFFVVADGLSGTELWTSDGTEAGTRLVRDIVPGVGSSSPTLLTAVGDTLYFVANDGVNGSELWKSDGTEAGTVLVTELRPGAESTSPRELRAVAGTLYFVPQGDTGTLWKTDGTPEGTVRVDGVSPPVLGKLAVAGSRVYFFGGTAVGYELWRHDALSGETVSLRSFQPKLWNGRNVSSAFAAAGDTLFFAADGHIDGVATGREPWKTDGTPEGTVPVADVRGPEHGSAPVPVVDLSGKLLFSARGESGGYGLWKTDGRQVGTERVMDTLNWPIASAQYLPQVVGGVAYFMGNDGLSGNELWRTDGTSAGTWLVKDIEPEGSLGSWPIYLTLLNGKLLFSATTTTAGVTLWESDGTSEGTRMLKDFNLASTSTYWGGPSDLLRMGDVVYFSADDGVNGYELWKTDGTEAGTVLVKDLRTGSAGSGPGLLTNVNGTLVFTARDDTATVGLWRLDASGTPLQVTLSGASTHQPTKLTMANGKLFFFTSADSGSAALWTYDGTSDSAALVATGLFSSAIGHVAAAGGRFFFQASTAEHGRELWRSDGTSAGTYRVTDIIPGPVGGVHNFPMLGLEARGLVVFRATDGEHGVEPWVSDGTPEGTRMAGDIAPGPRGSLPYNFLPGGGNSVFFRANDGVHGDELWRFTLSPDTTAPVLTCPAAPALEATSAAGAPVTWADATASDDVTNWPVVTYSHASGSLFPLGQTAVTVTAEDEAGNTSACTFDVTVVDTLAPVLTCPANLVLEATGVEGAPATFAATASDAVTTSPVVTYSHASGGTLPLGTTSVTATAKDAAGNEATCSLSVTVRDTTAPALTCPADVTVTATDASGAPVSFPAATASDAVTAGSQVTYSHASGRTFPPGRTSVTVTAKDAAGNTATCSFHVSVAREVRTLPGSGGCTAAGSSSAGLWGALALLAWLAFGRAWPRRS